MKKLIVLLLLFTACQPTRLTYVDHTDHRGKTDLAPINTGGIALYITLPF